MAKALDRFMEALRILLQVERGAVLLQGLLHQRGSPCM